MMFILCIKTTNSLGGDCTAVIGEVKPDLPCKTEAEEKFTTIIFCLYLLTFTDDI